MRARDEALKLDPTMRVEAMGDSWIVCVGWMGGYLAELPTEAAAWIRGHEIARAKFADYAPRSPPVPVIPPDDPIEAIIPSTLEPHVTTGFAQVLT